MMTGDDSSDSIFPVLSPSTMIAFQTELSQKSWSFEAEKMNWTAPFYAGLNTNGVDRRKAFNHYVAEYNGD